MPETPPSLAALLETGVALARRSTSGSLLFGRLAGVVHADTLPDRMRDPVRRELDDAFERTATAMPPKTVERALKAAWGRSPDRVLDELDPEPLSTSSTAQVHAAVFEDRPIALKVLRPAVATTVRSELTLLDLIGGPLGGVFPGLDVGATLRELREAALDELDLEHEGDQQQRVRRALRGVDGLVVPEVIGDLGSEGVLATVRLEGPTLAVSRGDDPGAVARRLVEAHLVAWAEAGLVLTDARASHVVHLPDGRTGLLGAGVARPVPRERAAAGVAALAGLGDPDPAAFVAAVTGDGLGVLESDVAVEAHALLREVLGELADGPALLDGPALAEMARRALRRVGPLVALAGQARPQPADLAALRMLGQLASTLSRLGVTEDWSGLASGVVAAR